MEGRADWPLGSALRDARELAGLSVPKAAERTGGAVSVTRWRHLEAGVQKANGLTVPVKTTRRTVIAAAQAVGLDANEALKMANLPPLTGRREIEQARRNTESGPPAASAPTRGPLSAYSDAELATELARRLNGRGKSATPTGAKEDAPPEEESEYFFIPGERGVPARTEG